ncbi:MICOS complex subunit MIC27-like [Prinia subflava]|uniref:MICOS complex subunit MIC27-like n=1 Tax=Prinia subflava TaxID=208062 RepID=UPI002FE03726
MVAQRRWRSPSVAKLASVSFGLPFVCITVYAAAEKESKSQLVKSDKLPICSAPPLKSKYIEEQPGCLQQQQRTISHYFGWCQLLCVSHQTYEAVRSLWADKETVTKLQQESKPIMQEDKKKKGISSTKSESAVESRSFKRTKSSPVDSWSNEDPVSSSGAGKTSKFKTDPKLMDHGQSSPEDVDMYSTRS